MDRDYDIVSKQFVFEQFRGYEQFVSNQKPRDRDGSSFWRCEEKEILASFLRWSGCRVVQVLLRRSRRLVPAASRGEREGTTAKRERHTAARGQTKSMPVSHGVVKLHGELPARRDRDRGEVKSMVRDSWRVDSLSYLGRVDSYELTELTWPS
ncbi:unnamed protein product [Arabis nemorensis]|uniref:Uncharacterized protein n=1 Tax=Arabis nemorensis TaxID=586526 RepID=A0A565AUA5_9BRAS|nr:unnamed protein product [Arabis nemorensis]